MRTIRILCGMLCVVCFYCLSSCSASERSAEEILFALCDEAGTLPAGEIYRMGAEEGSEGYLPPSLRDVLYGEEAAELFCLMEDYALYLSSFAAPREIAVFRLRSASDAERVAAMCLRRADTLQVLLHSTAFWELTDSVRVICKGKTVIMGLTDQPDEWERAALRLT